MKTIGVAEFKEQCLELIDEVDHVGLIITKDGSPVARITRFEGEGYVGDVVIPNEVARITRFSCLQPCIELHGSIFSTGTHYQDDVRDRLRMSVDELDDEGVVITKGGKVVATLTKYEGKSADLIGYMKDEIVIRDDAMDVDDRWQKGIQW